MTRSHLIASGELDWRVWGIQSSERHCCSPSWFRDIGALNEEMDAAGARLSMGRSSS
jgi:hypothetical protein